jgi:hypothetical protein
MVQAIFSILIRTLMGIHESWSLWKTLDGTNSAKAFEDVELFY